MSDAIGDEQPSLSVVIEASAVSFQVMDANNAGSHDDDSRSHATESIDISRISDVRRFNDRNDITEENDAHGQLKKRTKIPVQQVLCKRSKHCSVTPDCGVHDSTCQDQPAFNQSKRCRTGRYAPSEAEAESLPFMGQSLRKRSFAKNPDSQVVFKVKKTSASPFPLPAPLTQMAADNCEKVPDPAVSSKHAHQESNLKDRISEHGRDHSKNRDYGGASMYEHGRRKSECKQCGGTSFCEHGR